MKIFFKVTVLCGVIGLLGPSLALKAADVYVRANQVGYRPNQAKIAIALSDAAITSSFAIIDASSGIQVFTGQTKSVAERWGKFSNHAELDFSGLQSPGVYKISVGDAQSHPFRVDAVVYN